MGRWWTTPSHEKTQVGQAMKEKKEHDLGGENKALGLVKTSAKGKRIAGTFVQTWGKKGFTIRRNLQEGGRKGKQGGQLKEENSRNKDPKMGEYWGLSDWEKETTNPRRKGRDGPCGQKQLKKQPKKKGRMIKKKGETLEGNNLNGERKEVQIGPRIQQVNGH